MATSDEQPPNWIQDHIQRYLQSNGDDGHIWNGVPTLLLTTTGRRSGRLITMPLIYGVDIDRYLVVASKGGAVRHPAWYLNLMQTPSVRIQIGGETFSANARTASPVEKPLLWSIMIDVWPEYESYQSRTKRIIPVVILERANS